LICFLAYTGRLVEDAIQLMKTKITPIKTTLLVAGLLTAFASPSRAAEAKENWEKHCLKCHGADGKGQTKMGRQSGAKDYTDPKVQADLKDDNALKIIKEGIVEKGKKKMDPYKEKLSDDEIKALIAYIRAFKK
jgi:mono/diheme cytochrome c family protein